MSGELHYDSTAEGEERGGEGGEGRRGEESCVPGARPGLKF